MTCHGAFMAPREAGREVWVAEVVMRRARWRRHIAAWRRASAGAECRLRRKPVTAARQFT